MCTQSHSHVESEMSHRFKSVRGTIDSGQVPELVIRKLSELTRRKEICRTGIAKHNTIPGISSVIFHLLGFNLSYGKMQRINLASGWLRSLLFPSHVEVKSTKCSHYRIFGVLLLGSEIQMFYHFQGTWWYSTAHEIIKKKNKSIILVLCDYCHDAPDALIVLRHKVQIVPGSRLILQMHPPDTRVRTSLYYCQNTRKTVWDKCVLLCRKFDTFYSYMKVFNKL